MNQEKKRAYNFNAGPSAIPLDVLKKAQQELVNFKKTGMSVMELSHRSKEFGDVHHDAIARFRKIYSIPHHYEVLFLQGGASTQFAMVPMNFLDANSKAGYVITGAWSEKALKEAAHFGNAYEIASSKENNFQGIPVISLGQLDQKDAYVHLTTNNTIFGTQWHDIPNTGSIPLVADMSSDILSRPVHVEQFDLIYAGAQKNLGPSGVTVVIIKKSLLEKADQNIPTMFRYRTHVEKNSLYNTPPTFGIYMLGEVLRWVENQGGLTVIADQNEKKARIIYDAIDKSNGFYLGHADEKDRSLMNITFRLAQAPLRQRFLTKAKAAGFVGLDGHRSIGGCRASIYNAVPMETCQALVNFMTDFMKQNG